MEKLNEFKLEGRVLYSLYKSEDGLLVWEAVSRVPEWVGTVQTAIEYYYS